MKLKDVWAKKRLIFCIIKNYFFSCSYIKWSILPTKHMKIMTEVIIDRFGKLWLNKKHVEQQLGYKNLPAVTNKYYEKYKKCSMN